MKPFVLIVLSIGLVFCTGMTGQTGGVRPTPAALRMYADLRHLYIGAAVNTQALRLVPQYKETLSREFNMVVPENVMKWETIHPARDTYRFDEGDQLIAFAQANQMKVRGHTLVWHQQLPAWLTTGTFTRDELLDILHQHINTVVGHYKGQILAWDVVNEAIGDDGGMRASIWSRIIGPDFIDYAFRWAHEADPGALLFYNDYGGEGLGTKSNAIYELVKGMKDRGIPIDGVGLQMHIGIGSRLNPASVTANIKRIGDLGLQVHITEMDVKIQDGSGTQDQRLTAQADVYREITDVCLNAHPCTALLTWGFTDQYTWIPGFTHKADAPLLFDKSYTPKPAYHALMGRLVGDF